MQQHKNEYLFVSPRYYECCQHCAETHAAENIALCHQRDATVVSLSGETYNFVYIFLLPKKHRLIAREKAKVIWICMNKWQNFVFHSEFSGNGSSQQAVVDTKRTASPPMKPRMVISIALIAVDVDHLH